MTLADHWNELASIALLGADRRPVPAAPNGDIAALLDRLDRLDRPDPARLLLVQVAAMSAARRAGLRPNPALALLHPAPGDQRPVCPPVLNARLGEVLTAWPDLLEEWLDGVDAGGWRLTPDSAVGLLTRLRVNGALRDKTIALTGPLASWLFELFPAQFRASKPSKPPTSPTSPTAQIAPTPPAVLTAPVQRLVDAGPAIPADIADLLDIGEPAAMAGELARRLQTGALGNRNRASLQQLVRQLDKVFLGPLAAALERGATNANTMGLALSLGDLARFRLTMIQEFDR